MYLSRQDPGQVGEGRGTPRVRQSGAADHQGRRHAAQDRLMRPPERSKIL